MRTDKLNLGFWGEEKALEYLQKKGYILLERNWRSGNFEIDLILMDGPVLVFVEVKTREGNQHGNPESFVNAKKEGNLQKASLHYMHKIRHEGDIRFDIIGILVNDKKEIQDIYHLEDAFFPGL